MAEKTSPPQEKPLDEAAEGYLNSTERDDLDFETTVGPPKEKFQGSYEGSLEDQLEELAEEVMKKLKGKIKKFRMLEGYILAIVEVVDVEDIRKAIYLVLKKKEGDLLVFGGRYGKYVGEEQINFLIDRIDNAAIFEIKSEEIKKAIGEKVEKFKKELMTIGGKLIKFKISENNLFAIIEIVEKKTPAESQAIRDDFRENGEIIDCVEILEKGTYFVLKKGEAGWFIFADKEHGHKLSVSEKEKRFSTINDANSFIEQSKIIKEKFKFEE